MQRTEPTVYLLNIFSMIIFQPELVEFYYLWKKTPGANNNRPHRRRRAGSLRRNRVTRASNQPNNKKEETPEPTATESRRSSISKEDNSSLTEDDASECDSDSSITNKRECSRDWDECRMVELTEIFLKFFRCDIGWWG